MFVLGVFTQLSNSWLVHVCFESDPFSTYSSTELFLRSDFMYFIDENNCSFKNIKPKNDSMAGAMISLLQNNLPRFFMYLKLGFLCMCHFFVQIMLQYFQLFSQLSKFGCPKRIFLKFSHPGLPTAAAVMLQLNFFPT
jgi:hypothetical protein